MAKLTCLAVDPSHVSKVLEVARTIMQCRHDRDLIDKVTVLQGYLELSEISPNRDYGPLLHRALIEVTAAVNIHLEAEGSVFPI
jgi:hypothetical protein